MNPERSSPPPCDESVAPSRDGFAVPFARTGRREPLRLAAAAGLSVLLAACASAPPPPPPAPALPPLRPPHAPPPPPAPPPPAPAPVAPALFIRPANGPIVGRFDNRTNKGVDIAGQAGDPIYAAADGRVVYVGSELKGYGNMVIVKHDATFLTAYAHAQTILVSENDLVRQGQKIAEMGRSGASRVMLHFEVRRSGAAVDPLPYLPGAGR